MLFGTTFLIDLQREVTRRAPGRAFRFLEQRPDALVRISVVTYGEFAEGFTPDEAAACREALRP